MNFLWEDAQHTSLTLWDIDREFHNAYHAYGQWQARRRQGRPFWVCLGMKTQDDTLGKALRLGRQVQRLMETGKGRFGKRFEQGDSTCHAILAAQLLRLQYEVKQPLYDCALSSTPTSIPLDNIIITAKSIRRICLTALRDQYKRFQLPLSAPILPPPRFKVEYCPFAKEVEKDLRDSRVSKLRAKRLKPNNRHDDRELCPECDACISVTAHSGLPDYRCILYTCHVARDPQSAHDNATFACKSCYKTFYDSYAFLDHVFQKQIGSGRSCLRRASASWTINKEYMESDPSLVEQCLKNCLLRELTRVRTLKTLKSQVLIRETGRHPSERSSILSL